MADKNEQRKQPHGGALDVRKKGDPPLPGAGRPRKLVNTVIAEMNAAGIKEVTGIEVIGAYKTLLNLTFAEIEKVSKDKDQPFLLKMVATEMMAGKGYEVLKDMIDRAHGKPANILSMNTDGSTDPDTGTSFAGINIIITGGGKPPITREEDLPDQ
jgi:hypothetical protein